MKKVNIQIYLFLGCLALNLIGIFALKTLVLSDEIGTIANGAYLAGTDWSEAFAAVGLNHYKYGQALMYIPLFDIFNNYVMIYRMALLINAVFISFIPCIGYTIAVKFLGFSRRQAVCSSVLIGLLPSSLLWSKFVWAETLLYFIPWVVLYLLMAAKDYPSFSKLKKGIWSLLIGFVPVLTYMVHTRGIVVPITVFIIIAVMRIFQKRILVHPAPYIGGLAGGLLIDKLCSNYLFEHLWLNRATNNSLSSMLMYFRQYDLLSWDGLRTFLNTIWGWMYSVICSSYGLAVIGVILAITGIVINIWKKEWGSEEEGILHLYGLLIFLGTFAIGVLFFIASSYEILNLDTGERFDKIIYGRYLAPAFGPLILIVFNDIFKKCAEMIESYMQTIIMTVIAIFAVFFACHSSFADHTSAAAIQISTLPVFLPGTVSIVDYFPNLERHLMICTFISFIGFLVVVLCIKKRKIYAMTGIISAAFIITYLWGVFICYQPISDFYSSEIEKTKKIIEPISSLNDSYPYMAVCTERGIFPYQFAFADYMVVGDQQGLSEDYDNLLLVDHDYENRHYLLSADFYRFDDTSNVLIKGDKLNSRINELGIETEKITVMDIYSLFGIYDSYGQFQSFDGYISAGGVYSTDPSILLEQGEYKLTILASDISETDILLEAVEGEEFIEIDRIENQNNILEYSFEITQQECGIRFNLWNTSLFDKYIDEIYLEKQ